MTTISAGATAGLLVALMATSARWAYHTHLPTTKATDDLAAPGAAGNVEQRPQPADRHAAALLTDARA